ncbi:DNA-binding protein Ikaros [Goodea atripinnis]|uniref:DNA-binding protein Ikaros n=2 Tax=Goodeidae TaxID=28758 RepID=A0ABV0PK68_9TELE
METEEAQEMAQMPGRESPPANEASEEAEEPMAVPEDLSASSTHQQNNRGDKGTRQHLTSTPTVHPDQH